MFKYHSVLPTGWYPDRFTYFKMVMSFCFRVLPIAMLYVNSIDILSVARHSCWTPLLHYFLHTASVFHSTFQRVGIFVGDSITTFCVGL